MNKRRLSYGLLVTLAAAAFVAGCGDSTPPAETAPQPSASAEPAPPPSSTADTTPPAEPAKPAEPPPPPPKPAKDKFTGKFVQDFSGDVAGAADVAAKKTAGKVDKDGKKYNAAMDKAKAAVALNTIETTATSFVWSVKGKPVHTITFELVKGDDPTNLVIRFTQDGKKPIKPPVEVAVSFSDDSTFSFTDPFTKKNPLKLVFKKQ